MFDSFFAWLLLPLGMALGWALARGRGAEVRAGSLAAGLDGPPTDDAQAIDALSRAAAAEPGTVELQLTLGGLFRRRGELDRAIRIHEAVLKRPLSVVEASKTRMELAQDYLKAGLLDRAEALLQELEGSGQQTAALELQLDLHEQSRDWVQAIDTARRLQAARGSSAAPRIAQYWCELAESARLNGELRAAAEAAQKALEQDPDCVRASIIQAALAESNKDWPEAIKAYWRAMQQNGRYFSEVVAKVERCYQEAGKAGDYTQFLDEAERTLGESAAPGLARARWLKSRNQDLRGYLGPQLALKPSREGLLLWLDGGAAEPAVQAVQEGLKKALQTQPRYACNACGMRPSVLFWQCPNCKKWGTVVPVEERL
jgi:lipopolysaccharide biosynthesis regulator YciM